MSPWIQENRDLFQNGRNPLVLELSGWNFDNDCTMNRVQGFRALETRTGGYGIERWKFHPFFLEENILKPLDLLDTLLDH